MGSQNEDLYGQHNNDEMPSPPRDNNQVAAWYDTDL